MRVWWIRRDLRLADNPALLAACWTGEEVVPLFVVDPVLWNPAGRARRTWLTASLRALHEALGGRLVVRSGDPRQVVAALAAQVGADSVHIAADHGPYGRRRDAAVCDALVRQQRQLVTTGTAYAIAPGLLRTGQGRPYAVFTPFHRAWLRHGIPAATPDAHDVRWAAGVGSEPLPDPRPEPGLPPGPATSSGAHPDPGLRLPPGAATNADPSPELLPDLPPAGERAARQAWQRFLADRVDGYGTSRDLPAADGTSGLSAHVKFEEIHPRALLADLDRRRQTPGVESFRRELAWREFCADQLWHHPGAARHDLRPTLSGMEHDAPDERWTAWCHGRTGYPLVDAGMRQLLAEGWMHNRVRMVVAGFLVKDLHLPWQLGARWFMRLLRDGDLASNGLNWQWVAGSGSDAAPYFRIFNPVVQGQRFDPTGEYVRRYVPELAHLPGTAAHTPWEVPDGYAGGYPPQIVDHARERAEALARLTRALGRA